jgi:intraflagellar transport protein 140
MLLNRQDELQKYVDGNSDKTLKKWLSQYAECQGELDVALKYAELAQDYLSVVRINCYCGNITQVLFWIREC